MADRYCAHGEYTYSATPTWNVAQDGDGLDTGIATPAIASIVFSAAPSSGTITLCGTTVSTTGVVGAASADAAADALAANINATTANAVTLFNAYQLRSCVYARGPSGGAAAGTCEVMSRAGSATLNSQTAFAHTLNNVSANNAWAGGASGAWGYYINDNTIGVIWPQSLAKWTYGCYAGTPGLIGSISSTDKLIVKGNGALISSNGAENYTLTTSQRYTVFDDGTTWSGVNSGFTIRLTSYGSGGGIITTGSTGSWAVFQGRSKYSLTIEFTGNSQFSYLAAGNNGQTGNYLVAVNVLFRRVSGTGQFYAGIVQATSQALYYRDCKFENLLSTTWTPVQNNVAGNYHSTRLILEDCEFTNPNLVGSPAAGVYINALAFTGPNVLCMRRCTCDVAAPPANITSSSYVQAVIEDMVGFSIPTALAGFIGTYSGPNADDVRAILMQNIGPNKDFRFEAPGGLVDWLSGQGYPTLDSYLPNGTLWSYRIRWGNSGSRLYDPYQILTFSKTNIVSTGAKVLSLELLLDSTYAASITDAHIAAVFTYINSSGDMVTETTFAGWEDWLTDTGTAIPSSSASWDLGSYTGHVARKLELTTTQSVLVDTEIEVSVLLFKDAPTAVQDVFVNPEIGMAAA